jgi:chromate transporter
VGGGLAAAAVFAPPFVIVITAAPHYRRFARNPQVKAFVQGVTAAAVGAIAGAVLILAKRSLVDWVTVLIALAVLIFLMKFKKIPEPALIFAAGGIGLLLHHSGA